MNSSFLKSLAFWVLLVLVCAAAGFWIVFMGFKLGALPDRQPQSSRIADATESASLIETSIELENNLTSVEILANNLEASENPKISTTTPTAATSTVETKTKTASVPVKATSSSPVAKPAASNTLKVPQKEVFKLNVPYFAQQYRNSCEAAALRMALAFRGIFVNDIQLISAMGYKPRPKDVIKNEWDDPQEMYVGAVDVVDISKGYGVYGKPVARAAQVYGRNAEFTMNITPEFLAKEIKEGNPIVLWGYTSLTESPYTWTAPSGNIVKAFKGEHARLVVGFEGSVTAPTGFYLHDSTTGKQFEYWSNARLMQQVNAVPGVTNQAVVVR